MKLQDLYLTEGIIKVPPTLLNKLNMYVASVYATQIANYIKTVNQIGSMSVTDRSNYDQIEQKKKELLPDLYKILNFLQSTYNAKILGNLSKIIGSSIKIDIPTDEFMSELPKNLQTPEVRENIENLITRIRISFDTDDRYYSGLSHQRQTGDHLIQITLHDLGKTPQQASKVIKSSMNTVYHEAQHYMQYEVINLVDRSKKQTQRKPEYTKHGDDYYASSVEFTPQIGDIGHLAIQNLEDMKENGELTGNMNKDITKAVSNILSSSYKNRIFSALKSYGEIDRHNKGLKTIYSMVAKKYKDVLDNYSTDDTPKELDDTEDLDTDVDALDTLYNIAEDSKFEVLTSFGAMKELKKLKVKLKDDEYNIVSFIENDDSSYDIILTKGMNEKYKLHFDDTKMFSQYAREVLGTTDPENLLETFEWMEYDLKPEVSPESIQNMLEELQKQYGGKVDGNYIVLPNADDGSDGYINFKTGKESKDGKVGVFLKEIEDLSFEDMKEIATEILKAEPKGADLVYKAVEDSSTKEEVLDKLKKISSKNAIDDSDIERVLSKAKHDTEEVYQHQGEAKIFPDRLKISFKFPDFVRFQPGTKDKYSVEMVYKGNWHTIPMDDLYDVVYYIVMTYDQEKEYITKLLSSSEYSDEQFIKRIKEAHMGEDNYWEW